MNREDGFPIADIDAGLFHDQKVVALARRLRDDQKTATAVALFTNLVLESWAAGDRLTIDETVPAWWFGPIDDIREDLHAVGLIDDESRIPVESWTSWFVPAFDRREKRRQSGAEGGRRSWQSRRDKRRRSDGSATPNPSVLPSGRPAVLPSGRPSRNGREAQPPPAGAEAPSSAAPDREPEQRPAGWWPREGSKPTTGEEAQANVAKIRAEGVLERDPRRRQAEQLARELDTGATNGRTPPPGVELVGLGRSST